MITTLNRYIGRDLLKVSILASSVFSLVMTTFSVIEPLRKQGLAGGQVLTLFWYLTPVMLSLTLPVAVLFAATYVYGRFSMDNELTASRAGGISLYALMTPAAVAGVLVGLTTLLLSNQVAPDLARRGAVTVRKNIKGLIYQKLQHESSYYFPEPGWMLHADSADRRSDQLRGLVVLDLSDRNSLSYFTASLARVEFEETDQGASVSVVAVNPTHGERDDNRIFELGHFVFGPHPLDMSVLKEKTSFYTWGELLEILDDPRKSLSVHERLEEIYCSLRQVYFANEMAAVINDGREYELYHGPSQRYVFTADAAQIGADAKLELLASPPDALGGVLPVRLMVFDADNRLTRLMECGRAVFRVKSLQQDAAVSVQLEDVSILPLEDEQAGVVRRRNYPVGLLDLPASVERRLRGVTLEDLYRRPDRYPLVEKQTNKLNDNIRHELRPRVIAEINGRLAYGSGCVLLIPVGAALGLRYRGGHILSAFALACAPAVVLLLMMLMGQQMMSNRDASQGLGLAAIWSGVAMLAALAAWQFAVTLRK